MYQKENRRWNVHELADLYRPPSFIRQFPCSVRHTPRAFPGRQRKDTNVYDEKQSSTKPKWEEVRATPGTYSWWKRYSEVVKSVRRQSTRNPSTETENLDYYARGGIKVFEALRWGMIEKRLGNTALEQPELNVVNFFPTGLIASAIVFKTENKSKICERLSFANFSLVMAMRRENSHP
ncbi:hypothetical protein WH47_07557 [Habropoda laboriosa]|uniref:Uncharacterized protein n=1 Tax=Habropoda laboriosa TaxID=597456 RepID=A0A0L7REE7_9HYME|nr:hypothetical protein WH47_07557 [Habropoda laboriosa]